ncbi:MAG: hypothetical protein IT581_12240 [Verrucomicrobiales bacterium]|nr:hypothetical protein [Verrucomicrobiales bacterium]
MSWMHVVDGLESKLAAGEEGRRKIGTPWGESHSLRRLEAGVWLVTTASHGGVLLGSARWAEVRAEMPRFEPWAGEGALEEDEDVMVAMALWPHLFGADPERAFLWALNMPGTATGTMLRIAEWLHMPRGWSFMLRVEAWKRANEGLWERGGGCTSGGNWVSHWRQIGSGNGRSITTRELPSIGLRTTSELDALAAGESAERVPTAEELSAALAWALEHVSDDLDPDHQAALAGARALVARAGVGAGVEG